MTERLNTRGLIDANLFKHPNVRMFVFSLTLVSSYAKMHLVLKALKWLGEVGVCKTAFSYCI